MKKLITFSFLLLLAGCASPQKRIAQNPELFASFPPEVQKALRDGTIDLGFGPEMVEMALGRPDRIYIRRSQGQQETDWVYLTLYREIRTQPLILSGVRGNAWVDVENIREVPVCTVTFAEGNVSMIETLQDP